ncbi:MAG: hypothetical protein FWG97_03885 [Deltaproteobacteria bacterium]|nr:hypothetical protein [Deltaproteobacteria bacterium]
MNNPETAHSQLPSKIILFIVTVFGLVLLAQGRLENLANASAFAITYIGALLNRLDSRHQGYRATISAGGVTATVERHARSKRPEGQGGDMDDGDDEEEDEELERPGEREGFWPLKVGRPNA